MDFSNFHFLELLSEDEVEIAATTRARTGLVGVDIVESIGPVDTHQSHHGEEDADTETC